MSYRSLKGLAIGIAPLALAVASLVPSTTAASQDVVSPDMTTPVTARWSTDAAQDLLKAVEAASDEGLNPSDYAPSALKAAIDAGPGAQLDMAADRSATALAQDYLFGRVKDKAAFDWHIERSAYDGLALEHGLADAVASGRVRSWLTALLPKSDQYRALRSALAEASDPAEVAMIRANMERWRWMPRDLGKDYLFVNVPEYELRVMRDGREESRYDVVVGAPKTPTPALAVAAERVVVNPWWTLPPSVLAEGRRYSPAKGYVYTRAASGKVMVRQKPGPNNALGRVKIDMPNPHAIYLHDTPAKAAFDRPNRALSHGCIRVRDIDQLAAELGDDARVNEALADTRTATIPVERAVPVYIVYLTAEAEGGQIKPLRDIYGRDAKLLAALDGPTRTAARLGTTRLAAR